MHSPLLAHLRTIGALCRHAGRKYNSKCKYDGDDAIEQEQHGVIPRGILIDSQSLIVCLTLFPGSQGDKVSDGAYTECNHVKDISDLNGQKDQPPHDLFIQNISEAKD